ncbi:MAG: DUF4372 domain-containing protein [Candidatus Saganbacteria bacterium]|nr:DUF4372 domain-containing protein [Candidatus Saganbacteria bacterium]
MSHYNTVFYELLKLIPRHEFENAVYRHQGDYRVRRMNCWNHFATLLYAQISGKDSLRDIEMGRPYQIYEQVFNKALERTYRITTKHKFKFNNPYNAFQPDSITKLVRKKA